MEPEHRRADPGAAPTGCGSVPGGLRDGLRLVSLGNRMNGLERLAALVMIQRKGQNRGSARPQIIPLRQQRVPHYGNRILSSTAPTVQDSA